MRSWKEIYRSLGTRGEVEIIAPGSFGVPSGPTTLRPSEGLTPNQTVPVKCPWTESHGHSERRSEPPKRVPSQDVRGRVQFTLFPGPRVMNYTFKGVMGVKNDPAKTAPTRAPSEREERMVVTPDRGLRIGPLLVTEDRGMGGWGKDSKVSDHFGRRGFGGATVGVKR